MASITPEERAYRKQALRFYLVAGGMILFLCAGMFAIRKLDLMEKFNLDFRGAVTEGTVERLTPDRYRISYKHPSGSIESRSYEGSFGLQRVPEDGGTIRVAYQPEIPSQFQPHGRSYGPLAVVAALLGTAFGLGIYMNVLARRIRRQARQERR